VAEWENYIRPKLKVARDRGHFDIHKVGTEILKSFSQSSARFTLQFEQFAADKPMADIPRYFLASLELVSIGPYFGWGRFCLLPLMVLAVAGLDGVHCGRVCGLKDRKDSIYVCVYVCI
jgi:Protein of unknown function (DUF1032).